MDFNSVFLRSNENYKVYIYIYVYVLINYFTKLFDKRLYGDKGVGSYSSVLIFTFMEKSL